MPLKVEFLFDFGSPNAYLAELVLPGIEWRTGVKFEYVPVLLGGIFKGTGNMSPFDSLRGIKNKPEYQALETQRFIRRHNVTKFRQNPFLTSSCCARAINRSISMPEEMNAFRKVSRSSIFFGSSHI